MPLMTDAHEERARLFSEMRALVADAESQGRDLHSLTADEATKYDRMETEMRSLTQKIERDDRYRSLSQSMGSPVPVITGSSNASTTTIDNTETRAQAHSSAFTALVRYGIGNLPAEQRDLLLPTETRAQGISVDAAGGYMVPDSFRAQFVEQLAVYGGMRDAATVITTSDGRPMPVPTVDERTVKGAILAENTQVTEDDVEVGTVSLGAFMWTSKLVRASVQFIQDSAIDVDSWLRGILAARIGRAQNEKFTVGAGTTEPEGIVGGRDTGKDVTSTGASAGTLAYADLIGVMGKVDPAYRSLPGTAWMFNDAVVGSVRLLVDTTGRALWEMSLQAGVPDRLLGYPIIYNSDLDATPTTVGDVIALYGNFRQAYLIRDVNALQILRLTERYADYLQVGFLGFHRSDGAVVNDQAYAAIKE